MKPPGCSPLIWLPTPSSPGTVSPASTGRQRGARTPVALQGALAVAALFAAPRSNGRARRASVAGPSLSPIAAAGLGPKLPGRFQAHGAAAAHYYSVCLDHEEAAL